MIQRLEVKCTCGLWGRLTGSTKMKNGKQICKFLCSCHNPKVNYDKPFYDGHN